MALPLLLTGLRVGLLAAGRGGLAASRTGMSLAAGVAGRAVQGTGRMAGSAYRSTRSALRRGRRRGGEPEGPSGEFPDFGGTELDYTALVDEDSPLEDVRPPDIKSMLDKALSDTAPPVVEVSDTDEDKQHDVVASLVESLNDKISGLVKAIEDTGAANDLHHKKIAGKLEEQEREDELVERRIAAQIRGDYYTEEVTEGRSSGLLDALQGLLAAYIIGSAAFKEEFPKMLGELGTVLGDWAKDLLNEVLPDWAKDTFDSLTQSGLEQDVVELENKYNDLDRLLSGRAFGVRLSQDERTELEAQRTALARELAIAREKARLEDDPDLSSEQIRHAIGNVESNFSAIENTLQSGDQSGSMFDFISDISRGSVGSAPIEVPNLESVPQTPKVTTLPTIQGSQSGDVPSLTPPDSSNSFQTSIVPSVDPRATMTETVFN